ncbi:MAG: DUF4416 family protein [Deltaproteobacteria bacterium]|nr:DUF4416 family protein [Deltaproteobacteria bacterium]
MSQPELSENVKLIMSLFSPEKALVESVMEALFQQFGETDWISPEMFFDRTRYYEKEMGWPLHRRFLSFKKLIPPEMLVDIKLKTNDLEASYLEGQKRRINIDPGYISLERLVLATGKNYIHRIYLGKGIYADLTLVFKRGGFVPLDWTYPDYADANMIDDFNAIRSRYLDQLRKEKSID